MAGFQTHTTPALFTHASSVYAAMFAQAVEVEEEGQTKWYYEGALTTLVSALNMNTSMYSQVTKCLKAMGCAEMIRRGGGQGTSLWLLKGEPTIEKFREVQQAGVPIRGMPVDKESVAARMVDMNNRLTLLEQQVDQLRRIVLKFFENQAGSFE